MKKLNMQKTSGLSIAFIGGIALLFGVFTITISVRYGQLALPITYDDNGYFLDAIRRMSVWDNGTLLDMVQDFRRNPPHSPYSSFMCAAAFMLFGISNWAPAALNIGLVAMILLATRRMMPSIPLPWFMALCVPILTWPLMSFMVIESRPDLVCAGLTAVAALGIVQNNWLVAPRSHRFGMAALFGLAVLAKPSISPVTIATFFLCIVAASLVEVIENRPEKWKRFVLKANGGAILTVLLFCAVYSVHGWRTIIDYILFTTMGSQTDSYFVKDSFWDGALYYVTGVGGGAMIGPWLWPTIAIMIGGFIIAWYVKPSLTIPRLLAILAACAFLYLSVSATGFKTIYLGAVVPWLFFLFFLQGVNKIHEVGTPRVFAVVVLCLTIFGVLQYRSQWESKTGQLAMESEANATWRRHLLDSIAGDIAARGAGTIFFTATEQYVNATTLDLAIARVGASSTSVERSYSTSLAEYRSAWAGAAYVMAFSPDDPDVLAWLPSSKVAPAAWAELKNSHEFEPLRTFTRKSGGSIVLYGRVK